MRAHYDAAYRLQSAGKLDQADHEHLAFLVVALRRVANGYANTGDYAKAKPVYQEALHLAPAELTVLRDYAAAAIDANDYNTARDLLSATLAAPAGTPAETLAQLRRMQGDLELAVKGLGADLSDFKSAVTLDESCDNLFALANAELATRGADAADSDFTRYRRRCGDTPGSRLRIGRSYAINGVLDRALTEFRGVLALDSRYPGVHYCLGAAILQSSKTDFEPAEAEFKQELALHPNDPLSYAQLGRIALRSHHEQDAEHNFRRAIALNSSDPSNFIELGQLLVELNRNTEAEPLLRKAIELTPDPSRNDYAIERAHFQLGRVLMKEGRLEEAQRELDLASDLLNRSRHRAELRLNGDAASAIDLLAKTRVPNPLETRENEAYARRIAPLLAASYNNLGVHAAMASSFTIAVGDFSQAAHWNPSLPGVDANWGRSAYLAGKCSDAIAPLTRALHAHPADTELSNMLELCRQNRAAMQESNF